MFFRSWSAVPIVEFRAKPCHGSFRHPQLPLGFLQFPLQDLDARFGDMRSPGERAPAVMAEHIVRNSHRSRLCDVSAHMPSPISSSVMD